MAAHEPNRLRRVERTLADRAAFLLGLLPNLPAVALADWPDGRIEIIVDPDFAAAWRHMDKTLWP